MSEDGTEQNGTEATEDGTKQATDAVKTGRVEFTPEQQAEVNRIVKERLDREADKATKAAEKARKEAEQAALAKNAEWQTLAEQRAAEIAELTPFREEAQRASAALQRRLETELKTVPDHIRKLLADRHPAEQLDYIDENRSEWTKSGPPNINAGQGGRKQGSGKSEDELKAEAQRLGVNPDAYVQYRSTVR